MGVVCGGGMYMFSLFSAVRSYTGKFTEKFADSTGYGRLGDFAQICHGNTQFRNAVKNKTAQTV